ncbi:transketolase [Helicobacter canadensis]|uniref:Transketolase n=1 Tax=Helicobacter canadensis MIT 98-5491 TaxID=537970 RepID=C5ZW36_9HELI|nr:transketolase [Helicobacter canadensis]EES89136.1 transketolase [Helicobacter canadensis MIT 98-5491]EFR47916.1 transketolase [Helicobacter canadensis MIT 98-5491]STO99169.1 transketolase [Helicobacter canadensis]
MLDQNEIKEYQLMADSLRFLCADMVQIANSGHPGAPMGLADIAVVLGYHLHLNPKNPQWINRDRLVFSGGHASALVYSLLHLWGFDVSLEDLKAFRSFGSKTPGHPEYKHTPGIEITTGPLGQGIANAVGFAMAGKLAQNMLGDLISHKVYCLCGDGDLEEGISYESCSLAGHHSLDNLIVIYDSNNITIEGDCGVAFSENIKMRFEAQGWEVLEIDGHNFMQIDLALSKAKVSNKPVLIIAKTTIAKGSIHLSGSHKSHGSPLGESEIEESKKALGFDSKLKFFVPDSARIRFKNTQELGELANKEWEKILVKSDKKSLLEAMLNPDFSKIEYPNFDETKSVATRASNGEILNAIAKALPGFIGGSADLAPSNNTELKGMGDFPKGRNFHFGIREHAMGAISNAFANYGLFLPFCATFFVFSDYLSPSVRVASLMKSKVFYVWTHDSIGVGEDGATHQPIEQISHFRAMPNLSVFRPSDANENIACWQVALEIEGPCAFVLSRQNLPIFGKVTKEQVKKGAYVKQESSKEPQITLLATGSEVELALRSAKELESQGLATQVVSVPSYDLLMQQEKTYRDSLLKGKVIAIEASRGLEWYALADIVIGMQGFGASGKGEILFEHFGFSVENIVKIAKENL